MDPDLDIVQALHLAVKGLEHELHVIVVRAVGIGPEMERWFLDLNTFAAGVAQRQKLFIHGYRHVPDDFLVFFVFRGVEIQEKSHDLGAAGTETDGPGGFALGHAPDLGVIERPMLDLVHDARPAPTGVNLIEQRAGRVAQPWRARGLGLQVIAGEARPALQGVVVPRATGHVVVTVQVAVGQDIEAGAFLVTEDGR